MNTKTQKLYGRFRAAGYDAATSLRDAKRVLHFQEMEARGLVRLRAEPEQDNYFDVYGEPEGYTTIHGRKVSAEQERKDIEAQIERLGCWWIVSEYSTDGGETWEHADSIGMCTGYNDPLSPLENCYVPDLMRSACDKVAEDWEAVACGEH